MSKMVIYDPPMCCPTGMCGPSIDPELMRVATVLSNLKKRGVEIERYNLSQNPQAFVNNEAISELLKSEGADALPAAVVDGKIMKMKGYPTNEEFEQWLGVTLKPSVLGKPIRRKMQLRPKRLLLTGDD